MATSSPAATAAASVATDPPASRRTSKLLIGLVAVLGLAVAGAAAYVFVLPRFTEHAAAETAKAPVPEKPIFLMLEPLTVNLQSEGRSRFLQIGLALKLRDEQAKAQIVEFMPELRSRLLVLLSNRPPRIAGHLGRQGPAGHGDPQRLERAAGRGPARAGHRERVLQLLRRAVTTMPVCGPAIHGV